MGQLLSLCWADGTRGPEWPSSALEPQHPPDASSKGAWRSCLTFPFTLDRAQGLGLG